VWIDERISAVASQSLKFALFPGLRLGVVEVSDIRTVIAENDGAFRSSLSKVLNVGTVCKKVYVTPPFAKMSKDG